MHIYLIHFPIVIVEILLYIRFMLKLPRFGAGVSIAVLELSHSVAWIFFLLCCRLNRHIRRDGAIILQHEIDFARSQPRCWPHTAPSVLQDIDMLQLTCHGWSLLLCFGCAC